MAEATKAIKSLKRAANYTKLAMRDLGPRSFKKGQGALVKAVYKFGENGTIGKGALKKVLGWKGRDVRKVAQKAQRNGYVTIEDEEMEFLVSLTEKGTEVIRKRLEAEGRAADAVMAGLTDEERDTLVALADRVSKTCEELGVDYARIKKRKGRCCRKGRRAEGSRRPERGGCRCHGRHRGHGAPRFVFVFEDGQGGRGGHGCCGHHGHGHRHHDHGGAHGEAPKDAGRSEGKRGGGRKRKHGRS